jgi:hypothetical protein
MGRQMFDIIVLICALGMEPRECQPPTAVDQVFLGSVPNEIRCGIEGEEHLAHAASLVKPGYFIKITCVRRED